MGQSTVMNEIRSALLDAGGLSGINDDVVSKCKIERNLFLGSGYPLFNESDFISSLSFIC